MENFQEGKFWRIWQMMDNLHFPTNATENLSSDSPKYSLPFALAVTIR